MSIKPRAPTGMVCPYLNRDMSRVCHNCPKWVRVSMQHPQTGETIDKWDCADAWVPLLTIKTLQETERATVEMNRMRNELASAKQELGNVVAGIGNSVQTRMARLAEAPSAVRVLEG